MSKPITNEVAFRLRYERGLLLPTDREYDSPRLKEIAIRMEAMDIELSALDTEILAITKGN